MTGTFKSLCRNFSAYHRMIKEMYILYPELFRIDRIFLTNICIVILAFGIVPML